MPDTTDAKKILTVSPRGELEETTWTPSYYVDEDYPAIMLKLLYTVSKYASWYTL